MLILLNDEEKNALPAYQVVYDREPSNVQANLYLAIIYQRMKKYTDALGFYKNLTLLQPDQYKYWLYASSMFSVLDECLSQNLRPNTVTYFRSKADNYEKLNNYKKAIAQYDSAYYIFHKPLDMYYKGRVYDVFLNSKQQASTFYKKYITEQKTPQNDPEMQIFNYIKEYIKP